MSLPNQSLLDTKIQTTPQEYARLLRTGGDVFWWERGKFWCVTGHAAAEAALKNPALSCDRTALFIRRMPQLDLSLIQDFFGVVAKMMVMSDGAQHAARRKIAGLGVDEKLLEYFKPVVESTIHALMDRAEAKGHFDFVAEIAQVIPSIVLADLFHIPEEERPNFYKWSNNMTQFFGGASKYRNEDGREVNHSAASIRDYFIDLMARRRRSPRNDFLSIMLANQNRFGLDDTELVSQAAMMLVAGQVTTTDQMCNNVFTMLTHPGAYRRMVKSPELLPQALEELNRLDPAVTYLFRVVKEDAVLGGQAVTAGDEVFISAHAVNRDPRVFENPDGFVLPRARNPHLAFGHGPHFCLGAKLARMEMASVFGELVRRFPDLALHPNASAKRKHHSLAFSGFEFLPLVSKPLTMRRASRSKSSRISKATTGIRLA